MFLIDFGLQIYGVYAAFIGALVGNSAKCFDAPLLMLTLVRIVVVWNLITDSIYLLVVLVLVYSSIPKNAATNSDFNEYIGLWKRRIEWLISSPSSRKSEGQEVISQLSFLLANYFKQVDWAPSDVAVGLLLLKREQKQLVRLARLRNDSWEPRDWTPFETTVVTEYDDSVYEMQLLTRSASEKIAKTQIHKNITIAIDCQSTSGEVSGTSQSSKIQDHQEQRRFSEVSIKGIFERKMRNGLNSNHSFNTFELLPSPKAKTISEKHGYLSKDDNDFKSKKWTGNSLSENRRHSISEISVTLGSELANQQQLQSILHGSKSLHFNHDMVESDKDRRVSMDWRFASYSFQLQSDAKEITNIHIQDVLHFMHYANMAYVELDAEIQKKTDVLLHFSPLNDLFRAPYLVSVDHDWNAIVIAIRGTMSIADLLVDVTLAMDLLDVDLPHPEKYKVHSGMLRTAKNIVIEIMEHQVLEKLFAKNSRLSRYHIVVCGHSLGAV